MMDTDKLARVEKLTDLDQKKANAFLSKYENTSVFLLGNLDEHGPSLTSHANSGNFKLLCRGEEVIGIFCLTKRGNLLVQSELIQPVFELITKSCQEEDIKIRGVIGDWTFAKDFWQYLKAHKMIQKEIFYSKEINYTLSLDH